MKKTIFSTFLFIFFLLFVAVFYLSFFGYETDRFNQTIKTEVKKSQKNLELDFEKISVLLDIKKLTIFVNFINPKINYFRTPIPLRTLRTDIDLEPLVEKKLGVKKVLLATEYLDFNKIKPLIKQTQIKEGDLKNIKNARFRIKNLELEFDESFKLKDNFNISGIINTANIKISDEYEIKNLITNFSYEKNNLYLNEASWSFKDVPLGEREFFHGELNLKQKKKNYEIDLSFKTDQVSHFLKIPVMNYSFSKSNVAVVKTKFLINENKTIFFKDISIEDRDNQFEVKNLHLNKDYSLIDFREIKIKTSVDDDINNEFKVINKRDKINIEGKVFDAKAILKELSKDSKKDKFFKKISKDIEIDFDKILKVAEFPIKNFRLIGKIQKGTFEKITAKSDFSNNEHLDISLIKQKETDLKILEVHSDIAMPLVSDYKFFQGLDGGNLIYVSRFNNKRSFNEITINDFKLNDAPALAKIFTLADLKGLTDTLKGEGISFDTLLIKYESDPSTMTINEIFMIGPSVSVLVDGYVEKKSGLVSLRGTLVPAKQLNKLVSKIPVVGDILVGKKVGEGVFGLSFKIKGLPNDLKTTVNPVKTLAPRFITRAVEAAKKRKAKQQ
tara:strand:+ start:1121 stop:2962 length:1842 start_codon:yes stop_codon:yes gene_type:complete